MSTLCYETIAGQTTSGGTMRRRATITALAAAGIGLTSVLAGTAGTAGATTSSVKPHVQLEISDVSHDKIKADLSRSVYAAGDTWKSAIISWGDGQSSKLGVHKYAEHFYRLAASRQGYTETLTIKITTREHYTLTLKHALRLYNVPTPAPTPTTTPTPTDMTLNTARPRGGYGEKCDFNGGSYDSYLNGFEIDFPTSELGQNTGTGHEPYSNYTATIISGTSQVSSAMTVNQTDGTNLMYQRFEVSTTDQYKGAKSFTLEIGWDESNTGDNMDGHHTYDVTACAPSTPDNTDTNYSFTTPNPPLAISQ